jgi:uncharacterized protein (TIGR03435 family)
MMAKHAAVLLAGLGLLAAGFISASQTVPPSTAAAPPVFDVAAIRPSENGPRNNCYMKGQPGGQTFTGRCVPLGLIIKYAYKIIDSQMVGAPAWVDSEVYDFEAKTDRPVTRAEVGAMFQGLLADRFKLKLHKEARTMPALALTVDKGGNKMTVNETTYEWEIPVTNIPGKIPTIKGWRCPMSYLAWYLAQRENRPVVDKTGLGGFWDFKLEFVPDGMGEVRKLGTGETMPPLEGPSLSTAVREQLGLRLEPEKGPVDVYVIDHVEKASAN